jgi:hypothetical protein
MSIYKDFPKNNIIWKYSNPQTVRDKYEQIYREYIDDIKRRTNIDSIIYPSSRKDKKYMVFDGYKMVHFGSLGYEDFTKHLNNERRNRYLKRFNKDNMPAYSPYMLSKLLLW